jgi:hypothetical protein
VSTWCDWVPRVILTAACPRTCLLSESGWRLHWNAGANGSERPSAVLEALESKIRQDRLSALTCDYYGLFDDAVLRIYEAWQASSYR